MIDLHLGDCLDILPTLPDNSVDLIFTDPPYGHNNNNNGDLIHRREAALGHGPVREEDARAIANDGAEANDVYRAMLQEARRVLKPGCCCCCCCGGPDPQFARWSLWMDEALSFVQMIVWDKGPMGMGWRYRRSYETVLVGYKPGANMRWYDESKRIENVIRPGAFGVRKVIPQASDHPTAKPPQLARHFIRLHSQPDDVILDPFMGGGSTGMACVETERRFVGIELDAAFYNDAKRRIEDAQRKRDEQPALLS